MNLWAFEMLFEHRSRLYIEAEMSSVGIGRHISMLDCSQIQTHMATEVASFRVDRDKQTTHLMRTCIIQIVIAKKLFIRW